MEHHSYFPFFLPLATDEDHNQTFQITIKMKFNFDEIYWKHILQCLCFIKVKSHSRCFFKLRDAGHCIWPKIALNFGRKYAQNARHIFLVSQDFCLKQILKFSICMCVAYSVIPKLYFNWLQFRFSVWYRLMITAVNSDFNQLTVILYCFCCIKKYSSVNAMRFEPTTTHQVWLNG